MAVGSPNGSDGPIAYINVTPLVDVMLVLLIIFMVTAPMLQQGVDVDLPKATTGSLKGVAEQVVLSIDKDGRVFLGKGNEISLEELSEKIAAVMKVREEGQQKVYIKADTDIFYGRVMEVMGKLHKAGVSHIGLVSAPVDTVASSKRKAPSKSESKKKVS